MDEVKKKIKTDKPTVPQDRVTLTPLVSQKVNGWLDQLNDKFKGLIEVNRSDLTNYFLDRQPDVLNKDQIEKIKAAHYNEVRFMHWALQKMKESKKKGENLSLKDIMQLSQIGTGDDAKRTRKTKSAESSPSPSKNESDGSENIPNENLGLPDLA